MSYSQKRSAAIGGVLVIIAVFTFVFQNGRDGWPEVEAKVASVTLSCMMKAVERGVMTKTTSTAEIDCDDVESFKRFYPDLNWTTTERFAAILTIRNGSEFIKAPMDLKRADGRAPRVGDTLTVIQNPKKPTEVAVAGLSGTNYTISAGTGALGLLLLYLAFRKRTPKPLDDKTIALAQQIVAAAAAQGRSAPAPAAASPAEAPYRPINPDPIQSGRRAFGRRVT